VTKFERIIAELEATNAALQAELAAVRAEIADLRARLGLDSSNSSRPPSTDSPFKRPPPQPPTGRKPGGQPGHKGNHRAALEPTATVQDGTARDAAKRAVVAIEDRPGGVARRLVVAEALPGASALSEVEP